MADQRQEEVQIWKLGSAAGTSAPAPEVIIKPFTEFERKAWHDANGVGPLVRGYTLHDNPLGKIQRSSPVKTPNEYDSEVVGGCEGAD